MERYCGYLQAGLRSRSHPWANLSNRVLHKAYLDQIDVYYDLDDDLTITSSKDLRRGEKVLDNCWFLFPLIQRFISPIFRSTVDFATTMQEIICAGQRIAIQDISILFCRHGTPEIGQNS